MKKIALTLFVLTLTCISANAQFKKTWDFTKGLSEKTIANLNADANWAYNGSDADGITNNWKNIGSIASDSYLIANRQVIPELEGLYFDIGSNKDNSIHIATTKLRLTRRGTKITFPKLANGQKITFVGRSVNGNATNRGIAPVQDYIKFIEGEQTDGQSIFLGNQVEGSLGTYTFVYQVLTENTDSVDVQFQLSPDGGIDFTLFQIEEVDLPQLCKCEIDGIYYLLNVTTKKATVTNSSSSNNGLNPYSNSSYAGSIIIPNTIKYDGKTYTVTNIEGSAFSGCSGLTSVEINSKTIGTWFSGLTSIKTITLGEEVTSIGESAFLGCSGLTSVTIPSSVTSIENSAFSGCSGLTSVEINTKTIGTWFRGLESIKTITLGEEVTCIGNSAFSGCSGLTSITIPSSVTSIEGSAFYGCSGLTSVTIPSSVTGIGERAFSYCSGLTSIEIPSSVTSIGDEAFGGCSGLASITIPSSVTSIGNSAFSGCNNLTTVTINSNAILSKSYYSSSNINNINNIFGSQVTEYVIGEGVTSIGEWAFRGCSGLTSVVIPSSVTSIGDAAFSNCSGLLSVEIPSSVTSIGGGAFNGCSGLTSVTIPSSVTSIGNYTFNGCSGLTSITIPSSVTSIGNSAFSGCSGLTSIAIPSSVTSIGNSAFSGCSNLTAVTINSNALLSKSYSSSSNINKLFGSQVTEYVLGEGVTSIGDYAFSGCSGLTSITVPNTVTSIGSSAFYNCSGLTSVTIPSNVTSIESSAFSGCNGLNKVIVKDIAAWCKIAFANSSSNPLYYAHHLFSDENTEITKLIIPNNVTSIGNSAFMNCSGLTSIEIPSTVTSIGSYAFQNCTSLRDITSEITDVFVTGDNAFTGCENATLHVPAGTYVAYSGRADWNRIIHIVEGTEGFKMTMACNTKGKVLVNNETIFTNKIKDVEVNEEEENTFEFIPNEGCKLEQVTLNGLDVISSVENNTLKAVIPANSQMNVVFSKAGDMNNDGNIDISDVVSLVNMILGQ